MNACFISYRHSGDPNAQRIVTAFHEALSGQVSLAAPDAKVYLDCHRLRAADFFNPELARQLCRSSCMILLYNPFYFDLDHTYCAREYRAMVAIEIERLGRLPEEDRTHGLIIPVVIRGEDSLPKEIRESRHYYSFDKILLQPADFTRKKVCLEKVAAIAEIVYRRYRLIRKFHSDVFARCSEFSFPSDEEIQEWLNTIVSEQPDQRMPGH